MKQSISRVKIAPQPTLDVPHDTLTGIRLRPIRLQDAKACFQLLNHPDVFPYIDHDTVPCTLTQMRHSIKHYRTAYLLHQSMHWGIYHQDQLIGLFEICDINGSEATSSCRLSPQYWGQGIVPACEHVVMSFVFDTTALTAIYSYVMYSNQRCLAMMKKTSQEYIGTCRMLMNGKMPHIHHFIAHKRDYFGDTHRPI